MDLRGDMPACGPITPQYDKTSPKFIANLLDSREEGAREDTR